MNSEWDRFLNIVTPMVEEHPDSSSFITTIAGALNVLSAYSVS